MIEWLQQTEGARHGRIHISAGTNSSAYRSIFLPFYEVGRVTQPKIVLMAGVHGDEYEGQVVLNKLVNRLTPDKLRLSVVIVPCANPLACESGTRFSPDDNGNLANAFATTDAMTSTRAIASAIAQHLFSGADLVIDLHAGGASLVYRPCALLLTHPDRKLQDRARSALEWLGVETVIIKEFHGSPSFIASAATGAGAAYIPLELGGGGCIDVEIVGFIERALENLVCRPQTDMTGLGTSKLRWLRTIASQHYLYSEADGIFERMVGLGENVAEGQTAGWLHQPLEKPGQTNELTFRGGGEVVAYRHFAKCRKGDCLIELAVASQPPP
jgi:predicted deacylase